MFLRLGVALTLLFFSAAIGGARNESLVKNGWSKLLVPSPVTYILTWLAPVGSIHFEFFFFFLLVLHPGWVGNATVLTSPESAWAIPADGTGNNEDNPSPHFLCSLFSVPFVTILCFFFFFLLHFASSMQASAPGGRGLCGTLHRPQPIP